jgi:hypothetical protein
MMRLFRRHRPMVLTIAVSIAVVLASLIVFTRFHPG